MNPVQRLAAVAAAAFLASCGGSGDGGSAAQVDGAIVKGPVAGATVCAFALAGGAKGGALRVQATQAGGVVDANGCFVTGNDGAYAFTVPGYAGELLLEAVGGRYCTDENPLSNGACTGGGTVVTLAEPMTAAATVSGGSRSTTYVTPLTTAAVNAALANGGLTVETFRGRFTTLAGQVIGPNTTVTPATPPTTASQPFLVDVAKSVAQGGKLADAIQQLQSGSTGGGGGTSPATVNAALAGSYTLAFYKGGGSGCGTACSYTEGQSVAVTIGANGTLQIGTLTLSSPFYRSYGGTPNLHEVIWLDAANNIEYALSDNADGHFNEINVGNAANKTAGVPSFIGQIRQAKQDGATALAPLVGTFPVAWQYSGAPVAWTSVTIGADGAITFLNGTTPLDTASAPSVTAAQVTEITDWTSCCGNVQIATSRDFDNVDDSFRVYRDNTGAARSIEYYTKSGTSQNDRIGVRLGTPDALPAPTMTVPQGEGIVGTIDGVPVDSSTLTFRDLRANAFSAETLNGNAPGLQVQLSLSIDQTITGGQTYDCLLSPTRQVIVGGRATTGGSQVGTTTGGRCKIYVDSYTAGSSATGRFVAEIVRSSQDDVPKLIQGAFKVQAAGG